LLIVVSMIASMFADVRIYTFPNSGRLYDLGFVLGAGAFFEEALARRRKKVAPAARDTVIINANLSQLTR